MGHRVPHLPPGSPNTHTHTHTHTHTRPNTHTHTHTHPPLHLFFTPATSALGLTWPQTDLASDPQSPQECFPLNHLRPLPRYERRGERKERTRGGQGNMATGACPASLLPLSGPGDGEGPLREKSEVCPSHFGSSSCWTLLPPSGPVASQHPQGEIHLGN